MEYGATDPYGTYQTKDNESPYEILLRLKSWQNQIRSTISKVNETIGGIHEQQTQILQNIDSIEISVLDIQSNASSMQQQISNILVEVGSIELIVARHTTNLDLKTTEIANLQLTQSQITLNVANIDNRLGTAESSLIINANAIAQKVSISQFNGSTISSLMVQDAYSFQWFAQQLGLNGLVTFSALEGNAGTTRINGANIMTGTMMLDRLWGSLLVVGNKATSTTMQFSTTDTGVHIIRSDRGGDSYSGSGGFRIENNSGSLGLYSNPSYGTYVSGGPLVAKSGFRVDIGISQFNTDVTVNASLNASYLNVQGSPVATQTWVANMNYLTYNTMTSYIAGLDLTTVAWVNNQLAQKERDIVAWANRTFVAK